MDETPLELDRSAFERAKASDAFGDRCWLTFYLVGPIKAQKALRPSLLELGAENLGKDFSPCIYPKVPVSLELSEIEGRVAQVQRLCVQTGVTIDLIDLDSLVDVETTKFVTLWKP